jgi:hypothetical protein
MLNLLWPGLRYFVPRIGKPLVEPVLERFWLLLERVALGSTIVAVLGLLVYVSYRWSPNRKGRATIGFVLDSYSVLVFVWGLIATVMFVLGQRVPLGEREGVSIYSCCLLALPATAIVAAFIVRLPLDEFLAAVAPYNRTFLLSAVILVSGAQIGMFFLRPTYTVKATADRLASVLKTRSVVMGELADTLCIESGAFSLRSYLGLNARAFEQFNPDYVMAVLQHASLDAPDAIPPQQPARGGMEKLLRFGLLPFGQEEGRYGYVVDLYSVKKTSNRSGPERSDGPVPFR